VEDVGTEVQEPTICAASEFVWNEERASASGVLMRMYEEDGEKDGE